MFVPIGIENAQNSSAFLFKNDFPLKDGANQRKNGECC